MIKIWNDTDVPLAYLITFRSYGTWLHGDERGSVGRFHNQYNSPRMPHDQKLQQRKLRQLKAEPVILNAAQRESVETAVRETCAVRERRLQAINVRTNHVHIVVSIGTASPDRALNDFKAYATRKTRQNGYWPFKHSPWVDKGSKRYLWNERNVELAIDYVENAQGDDLPDFD